MIMYILHMYNSKYPCTWCESLRYGQHSYNRTINNSIDHNPSKVGLGFNHWVIFMRNYPSLPYGKKPTMLTLRPTKLPNPLKKLSTFINQSIIFYREPIISMSSAMINAECHINFRWEIRFGFICKKNPYKTPLGFSSTSLWTLHHHQGYG